MNKQQAALLSIFSNTTLIIFKLIAGIAMGSISVLSEAIHSSIDLIASLIAFFSIRKAVQPEDDDHPFGHGKYENVSGLIEALLIIFAAAIIVYEAITKIIHGASVANVEAGIIVMLVASLVNLVISLSLLKISKKTNSIALEADAMHLLTDVFTSAGVLGGLIIIKITHIQILDPIVAFLVALLIVKAGIDLIKKSMTDLVDGSLPKNEIQLIIDIVNYHPEVTSYHRLRTRKCGDKREIDIHLRIRNDATLVEAHNLASTIEKEIKDKFNGAYVLVHVEPEKELKVSSV